MPAGILKRRFSHSGSARPSRAFVTQRFAQVAHRSEIMDRPELVDIRQHGADARALASKPSKRSSGLSQISRRQDLCSRSISRGRSCQAVALEPVGEQQHDRALAEHAARPVAVELVQRSRRCGCRPTSPARRAEQCASASSGSRRLQRAGDVGQPRAEQEGRDAAALLGQRVQEMQEEARVVGSSSRRCRRAPRSAGAARAGSRNASSIEAPPARSDERSVRRRSMRPPMRMRHEAPRRTVVVTAAAARAIARSAAAISAALIWAKSLFCSSSRIDDVKRASTSSACSGFGCGRCFISASETRGGAGFRLRRLSSSGRRDGRHQRDHLFHRAAAAPEDRERLIEDDGMLVLLHEHRMERPVEILARADAGGFDRREWHRATLPGPTGRPASRSARAKWRCSLRVFLSRSPPARDRHRRIGGPLVTRPRPRHARAVPDCTSSRSCLGLRAFDLGDVVLVFEQHAERVGDERRIERDRVELDQAPKPSRASRRRPAI